MWTTSRYAPKAIRVLALALSNAFSGNYVSRGKKKLDELVEEARKNGEERIFLLDNKRTIGIINVDEIGKWDWLAEQVEIHEE